MNVHNLMEELVYSGVNDLFDTAQKTKTEWLTCTCNQCRLDTICYVLNRVAPRYIKSGRGLAHNQLEELQDKAQLMADINRITLEGMKQVLSTQRPHIQEQNTLPQSPVFNFPTFVGRILDGLTFEPVKDIPVHLYMSNEIAQPIDSSWVNPYPITSHTPGTFTFWVKPLSASHETDKKVIPFEIRVEKKGYDPLRYYFEIAVTGESVIRTAYNSNHSFILPDLYLFPSEDPHSSMQD